MRQRRRRPITTTVLVLVVVVLAGSMGVGSTAKGEDQVSSPAIAEGERMLVHIARAVPAALLLDVVATTTTTTTTPAEIPAPVLHDVAAASAPPAARAPGPTSTDPPVGVDAPEAEAQPEPPPPPPPPAAPTHAWAVELLALVNTARSSAGLPALAHCAPLEAVAAAHALDQAEHDTLSHKGSDGSSLGQRVERAGYTGWTAIGENVSRGPGTPREAFDLWMGSDLHRANILNPGFGHVGMGRAIGNGESVLYWTQDFGRGGACG